MKKIIYLTFLFGAFSNFSNAQEVQQQITEQSPAISDADLVANAKTFLEQAKIANTAGDFVKAISLFQQAYETSPKNIDGRKIAMESAKRLGFAALEGRDIRRAEAYFTAEAVIGRKLYFEGAISPRAFSDAVGHWASGAGAMGRSNESAALVFYSREIKARAQAEVSSQILNRDASFNSDKVEAVRVSAGKMCVTEFVPFLAKQISCLDEQGARTEALSLQARQIKADAPPPMTKEEREKKEAERKKQGGGGGGDDGE